MLILLINHILSNFLLGLGLITEKSKFPPQKFVNNENSLEAPINIVINLVEKVSAILDDTKSENISVVDLKNKTSIADFFVIATCRSSRHANSTADEITLQLKNIGLVKTSSFDDLVTDSAAGGTAMATGTKTNNRAIGTDKDRPGMADGGDNGIGLVAHNLDMLSGV
mgnify:CR=1 FL=1